MEISVSISEEDQVEIFNRLFQEYFGEITVIVCANPDHPLSAYVYSRDYDPDFKCRIDIPLEPALNSGLKSEFADVQELVRICESVASKGREILDNWK